MFSLVIPRESEKRKIADAEGAGKLFLTSRDGNEPYSVSFNVGGIQFCAHSGQQRPPPQAVAGNANSAPSSLLILFCFVGAYKKHTHALGQTGQCWKSRYFKPDLRFPSILCGALWLPMMLGRVQNQAVVAPIECWMSGVFAVVKTCSCFYSRWRRFIKLMASLF